jgi:polyisoprenyl-teichoic acid--peptidoglycan teichoic acid transferase
VPDQKRQKYRVYRGGHVSENDPEAARFRFGQGASATATPPRAATPGGPVRPGLPGREVATVPPHRRFTIRWRRAIPIAVGVLFLLLLGWIYLGYRAFSDEVARANKRLDPKTKAALSPAGSMWRDPQVTLVLGSDGRGRKFSSARADSILLVRTDPGKHTIYMLSIPRDLRVLVPGYGNTKINSAFAYGGSPLLIKTIRSFTGLPVNHITYVAFAGFIDLINAMGGVTIDNPYRIQSSEQFGGRDWTFPKGEIHLNGRNALAYARIRKTTNPRDSDITRTERQQRVLQAIAHQLVTPTSIFHLRSIGSAVAKPLATDLSPTELMALGWIKFRAQRTVECHLGGTPQIVNGQDVIESSDRNRQVIDAFLGQSAPPPQPKGTLYDPGCTIR